MKGLRSLLTGLVAGIGLGVLFAPKKGKDLRENVKDNMDKGGVGMGLGVLKDAAMEMGKDIKKTYEETYDDVSKNKEVKKHFVKARKVAKDAYNKVKKAVKKAK
jgi:gas vesicle protein